MADWTTLPNLAVGVGGLPSGTTVTALRDNPIAIAEGAAGAPRVNGLALGGVYLGSLSRNVTDPIGIVDIGNFETLLLMGVIRSGVNIAFSTDNGSSFGAGQQININSNPNYGAYVISKSNGLMEFTGAQLGTTTTVDIYANGTRSLTIPSSANAFRLSITAADVGRYFSLSCYLIGGTQ